MPPLPGSLLSKGRCRRVVVGAWRDAGSIHLKEGRTSLMALRREARTPASHGLTILSLGDNMSELLAQDRGRAADHALNALCRRSASYQLGCGLRWRRRHVDTKENPSDEDSRLADRGGLRPGEVLRPQRLAAAPKPPPEPPPGLAPPLAATTSSSSTLRATAAAARGPAFLEIFSGCGRLTGAIVRSGLRAAPPIELAQGRHFDMLDRRIESVIAGWISRRRIWLIHFGTPCSRWSRARTTGRAGGAVDAKGMECAHVTIRLMRLCRKHAVNISIENPAGSGLWTYPPLEAELRRSACFVVNFPMCAYGAPYMKPTRIMTNAQSLASLSRTCTCTLPHEILCGLCKFQENGRVRSVWKTSIAGRYPPALCRAFARALLQEAPARALRAPGEPELAKGWEDRLAHVAGAEVQTYVGTPACPRRFATGWEHAIGFAMAGDSAQRRAAATRRQTEQCVVRRDSAEGAIQRSKALARRGQ